MDFETIDVLYRSRQTVLQILKAKGYNTVPYEKFGPFEIEAMATGKKGASLRMDVTREVPEDSTVASRCIVEYAIPKVKNRLASFVTGLTETEEGEPAFDYATTEVFVLTLESVSIDSDPFHNTALTLWSNLKLRIGFFDAHALVFNPLEHVLVPKHELLPPEEHAPLLKSLYTKSKLQLPMIKFHRDPIARLLGAIPGDILRITMPSPQAGETVKYRVCVP